VAAEKQFYDDLLTKCRRHPSDIPTDYSAQPPHLRIELDLAQSASRWPACSQSAWGESENWQLRLFVHLEPSQIGVGLPGG
jgi:hypothetical protein